MLPISLERLLTPFRASRRSPCLPDEAEDRIRFLVSRPEGVTIGEIAEDLDLSPGEVRVFLNGPLRRSLGHKVPSRVVLGLVRVYRLPEQYPS